MFSTEILTTLKPGSLVRRKCKHKDTQVQWKCFSKMADEAGRVAWNLRFFYTAFAIEFVKCKRKQVQTRVKCKRKRKCKCKKMNIFHFLRRRLCFYLSYGSLHVYFPAFASESAFEFASHV